MKYVEIDTPPAFKPANTKYCRIKIAIFDIRRYLMTGGKNENPPNIEGLLNLIRSWLNLSFCVLNIPKFISHSRTTGNPVILSKVS
jgi:hypothetical protein